MPQLTLTLAELATITGAAITLALLPGADLAKLALAVLYRKAGISPAYAESVQDGVDVPWTQARHRAFITGYTPSNRTRRTLEALGLES